MSGRVKVCALRASKPDQEAVGRDSGDRNPITGVARKEMRRVSHALDTGGGACNYKRRYSDPGAVSGYIPMGNPGLDVVTASAQACFFLRPSVAGHFEAFAMTASTLGRYRPKNGPLATFDVLLLARGMNRRLLYCQSAKRWRRIRSGRRLRFCERCRSGFLIG